MTEEAPPLRYDDPLRPITRKERTGLLVVSFIGLLISRAGLLPTKIETFGLEFPALDQRWLLLSCAILLAYFLLAFIIYAITDWLAHEDEAYRVWREGDRPADEILKEVIENDMARKGPMEELAKPIREKKLERSVALTMFSIRFAPVRYVFDLFLPPILGLASLVLVLTKAFNP